MTLIELLVVIGIIGLILGTGIPALTQYAKQARLKTTTRQMVGLLSLARSLAISHHEEHAVVVDAEQQEVRIVNVASGEALEQVIHVPSSISIELEVSGEPSPEAQVVFRPTGSLKGRTVSLVLADQQKSQTITVMGTTGTVAVQRSDDRQPGLDE